MNFADNFPANCCESRNHCSILDKRHSVDYYILSYLNRLAQAFEWQGLPDTIPGIELEKRLMTAGSVLYTESLKYPAILTGGVGGAPDYLYRGTRFTSGNPALKITGGFRILNHGSPAEEEDLPYEGILIYSDSCRVGLLPLLARTAQQLVECDISIRSSLIASRVKVAISARMDTDVKAAQQFFDGLEQGKVLAIGAKDFFDGIQISGLPEGGTGIKQLAELQQYLKAALYNDIGLESNQQNKREYVSGEELDTNKGPLLTISDDMLARREEAAALISEHYGRTISVKKSSAWAMLQEEVEAELEALNEPTEPSEPEGGDPDENA